jgi:hypothetical protein
MSKKSKKPSDTWLSECCRPHISIFTGVLSIDGSDGIKVTNEKVGRARFEEPEVVKIKAPTKKYSDWFREKYPDTTV